MADVTARTPRRPLDWSDSALDLLDRLSELDQPAYLVGGAVRDAMLRRSLKDLDIATPESGTRLARRIANLLGGAYFALDAERDVGRALLETADGRLVIDVATFRAPDLLQDLSDRDFTLNAMAVDLHGDPRMLIDPLHGEQDIIDRVLRRCSEDAIGRDPVRALRAVRQSVQFNMRIEPATLVDVRAHIPRLRDTSGERVRDEFFRLLGLPKAPAALKIANAVGALKVIVPAWEQLAPLGLWDRTLLRIERLGEVLLTIGPKRTDETAARFSLGMLAMGLDRYRGRLQAHTDIDWSDDRSHQALLVLALLLMPLEGTEAVSQVFSALPLSNRERERLTLLVRHQHALRVVEDVGSPLAQHRFWRMLGEAGIDICLLTLVTDLADAGVEIDQDAWIANIERARTMLSAYFDQYAQIVDPPMLVDGNLLMEALALRPGPEVGRLLDVLREAQVTGAIRTVEDALALARASTTAGG